MQLNTASNFTVVRQIANHTDTATYYVRAVIRNAYTDTILDTLDLTDKGSQRFKKDWKVPADPSGQGFYISIITSVYEDSGYTTKSASYGDEENTYLVADRMLGKGGGMGVSFGISDIRRVIKEELDKVEKPEPMKMPEMPKMKWEEVLSAISEIKDNAKEIQNNITEIPQTDLTPIHNHLSKIEKAVEDKPITPETDLTDIKEQLRKNTDAVMSVLEEAGASIVRIAQKSIREELGKVKWAYQRVIRGYDDTIYWAFDEYFSQFIAPLQNFCKDELVDTIDERRIKIFTETLKLIDNYREMTYMDNFKENNAEQRLWEYVGKNLRIYWN